MSARRGRRYSSRRVCIVPRRSRCNVGISLSFVNILLLPLPLLNYLLPSPHFLLLLLVLCAADAILVT
jgi:hypothetical protein